MGRPFFPVFFRHQELIQQMDDEQAGQLFHALFEYASDGVQPVLLDVMAKTVFFVMKADIDESLQKYEKTCERNRKNGKSGANKRWGNSEDDEENIANASDRYRTPPTASERNRTPTKTANERSEKSKNNGENIANASDRYRTPPKIAKRREAEAEEKQKRREENRREQQQEAVSADAAVSEKFSALFGRQPNRELLQAVDQSGLTSGEVMQAMQYAADKHPNNPEGYVTQILRGWKQSGVPERYRPAPDPNDPERPLEDWEKDWLQQLNARTQGAIGQETEVMNYAE